MQTSPDRSRRSGGHARSGPLLRPRDADAAQPRHRAPVATRTGTRARSSRVSTAVLAAGAAGAVVVLVGGATVLLGGDEPSARPSGTTARPSAAASAASPSVPPASPEDAATTAAVTAATGPDRTAADVRAALVEQLAARADANLALLRSTHAEDEAGAARAAQAVASSTAGLSSVVAVVQDEALAARLRTGLDRQTGASRDYAAAVAAGDVPAADRARAEMGAVSRDLGRVLAGVTGGRIAAYVPPQDAAQYRAYVDALEQGDTAAADEAATWLRARLAREGAALAPSLSGGGPT
jgi:hypothetical protein